MFSLSNLYHDYSHQTAYELITLIEHELSNYLGLGYAGTISELKKCIIIAQEYTNHHQKSPKTQMYNSNGELVRKSGEPYINHTLRVVLILIHERLFDEDVLKAAIMHDLYEDTTYTYEDAKRDFDKDVADLINCVTNVSEDQQQKVDECISPEELDYAEIIRKCNEHKIAFYIKFADRLDNLMTLDSMPIAGFSVIQRTVERQAEQFAFIVAHQRYRLCKGVDSVDQPAYDLLHPLQPVCDLCRVWGTVRLYDQYFHFGSAPITN